MRRRIIPSVSKLGFIVDSRLSTTMYERKGKIRLNWMGLSLISFLYLHWIWLLDCVYRRGIPALFGLTDHLTTPKAQRYLVSVLWFLGLDQLSCLKLDLQHYLLHWLHYPISNCYLLTVSSDFEHLVTCYSKCAIHCLQSYYLQLFTRKVAKEEWVSLGLAGRFL